MPPTVQNPGDMYRIATILGSSLEACQQVQAMIHRILSEQSSAGVMSENTNATTHHQQQQHYQQQQQSYYNNGPQENQPGYSAEWAAYHAAQQHQQQQQAVAATTQATTAPATVASANAAATNEYTEPFFRYAYYYGEDAARQYYGAWYTESIWCKSKWYYTASVNTGRVSSSSTRCNRSDDISTGNSRNNGSCRDDYCCSRYEYYYRKGGS
jgi:hypothetical protein